jgi:hypothetical protein
VRLAREVPVPDRRTQRNSLAVEPEFPVRRCQWRHDAIAATAWTQVYNGSVLNGDVKNTLVKLVRNKLTELVPELQIG